MSELEPGTQPEQSPEQLASEARTLIGKIVMFNPNKYIDEDPDSATPGHARLDSQLVEEGRTEVTLWFPPEQQDYRKINHDIAWSSGVYFKDTESGADAGLFFVTPNNQIVDKSLKLLDQAERSDLVARIRHIGIELGTPGLA